MLVTSQNELYFFITSNFFWTEFHFYKKTLLTDGNKSENCGFDFEKAYPISNL